MAEKIPTEQQPKYERAWQIFHRFFDDDLEDLKRLAKVAGSVDAVLKRRERLDRALEAWEERERREREAKEEWARRTGLVAKAFTMVSGAVAILVGLRAVGQWAGWWP